jgi:hypothetical protein
MMYDHARIHFAQASFQRSVMLSGLYPKLCIALESNSLALAAQSLLVNDIFRERLCCIYIIVSWLHLPPHQKLASCLRPVAFHLQKSIAECSIPVCMTHQCQAQGWDQEKLFEK